MTVPGAGKLGTFSLDKVWQFPRLHLAATTQRPERTLQVSAFSGFLFVWPSKFSENAVEGESGPFQPGQSVAGTSIAALGGAYRMAATCDPRMFLLSLSRLTTIESQHACFLSQIITLEYATLKFDSLVNRCSVGQKRWLICHPQKTESCKDLLFLSRSRSELMDPHV